MEKPVHDKRHRALSPVQTIFLQTIFYLLSFPKKNSRETHFGPTRYMPTNDDFATNESFLLESCVLWR